MGIRGKTYSYEYDAWGSLITLSDSSSNGIGTINPLRYRGYYYDTETGFYYLQSRYYDPVIGRFINADGAASTGQGFIGYNMFAYCGNNPVNRQDASGNAWNGTNTEVINDGQGASQLEIIAFWIKHSITWITNDDEDVVLNAKHLAFYKGVPVVKAPIGTDAFSYNIIIMGKDVSSRSDAVETVKHEYGHSVHAAIIGPLAYTFNAFIPSLIGYWSDVPCDEYYSQPWEYIADELGNVNRTAQGYTYASWTDTISKFYFWKTVLFP